MTKHILLSLLLLFMAGAVVAQISGPTEVYKNSTHTYSAHMCQLIDQENQTLSWVVSGGTINSDIYNQNEVSVTWGDGTQGMLMWGNKSVGFCSLTVSIEEPPPPPAAPPTPLLEHTCGSAILSFNGSPPSGTTWYWQGTNFRGESMSDSTSTYPVTESGVYHLRAKSIGGWSASTGRPVELNGEIPANPTTTGASRCQGGTVTMGSSHSSDRWYTVPSGGTSFHTGSSYTVNISATSTYYVEAETIFGCVSSGRTRVTATIWAQTNPGTLSGDKTTFCYSGTVNLSLSGETGTVGQWAYRYKAGSSGWSTWATFGNQSAGSNAYAMSNTGNTIKEYQFRVSVKNGDCATDYAYETVTINPRPTVTASAPDAPLCGSGVAGISLSSNVTGAAYQWTVQQTNVSGASNGSGSAINHTLSNTTGSPGTAVYTIWAKANGCASNSTEVTVYVSPQPVLTLSATPTAICESGSVTIDISSSVSRGTISWTAQQNNVTGASDDTGNRIEDQLSLVTNAEGSVTYTATSEAYGCEGTASTTIHVHPAPNVDAGADIYVFAGNASFTIPKGTPAEGNWSGDHVGAGGVFNVASAGAGSHQVTFSYIDNTVSHCGGSDTKYIIAEEVPAVEVAGDPTAGLGVERLLSVAAFSTYQWKYNGNNIAQATTGSYWAKKPGAYSVVVTNSDGFSTETEEVFLTSAIESQNINYIITGTYKVAVQDEDYYPEDIEELSQSTTYFDGLGREMQTVVTQNSPGRKDMISPVVYDAHGRVVQEFLPYAASSDVEGKYRPDAIDEDNYTLSTQYQFYQTSEAIAHDVAPYAIKRLENSPFNRVLEQSAPGVDWQMVEGNPQAGKTVKYHYKIDVGNLVREWAYSFDTERPEYIKNYQAGELTKNITINEEGHQVQEFTDKRGQAILKKVETGDASAPWADTYYIHDDFGSLRVVLPPEASRNISDYINGSDSEKEDFLNRWAFQYRYDGRKRIIEKRVPGADWVYMIYDSRDRLVLTQGGNQRFDGKNEWTFTKYDQLNRPILTGIADMGAKTQAQLRTEVGGVSVFFETRGTTVHGYTDQSYPTGVAADDYQSVTYYDDYSFMSDFGQAYEFEAPNQLTAEGAFPTTGFMRVKGLVTGSKIRSPEENIWLRTVTYYDDRYRVIQTVTDADASNIDRLSMLYNFPGWVLATYADYGGVLGIKRRYTYDHTGRLMKGYHQVFENNTGQGEVLLAENKYNELGELIEKNLHVENNSPLQSVDYRYNIRGWLESVNSGNLEVTPGQNPDDPQPDYFGMELIYNNPLNGVPTN